MLALDLNSVPVLARPRKRFGKGDRASLSGDGVGDNSVCGLLLVVLVRLGKRSLLLRVKV